jgi:hypothetical protein
MVDYFFECIICQEHDDLDGTFQRYRNDWWPEAIGIFDFKRSSSAMVEITPTLAHAILP